MRRSSDGVSNEQKCLRVQRVVAASGSQPLLVLGRPLRPSRLLGRRRV